MFGTIDRERIESRLRARVQLEVRLYEEHRLLDAARRLPLEVLNALADYTEDVAGYRRGRLEHVSRVLAEVTRGR